MRLYLNTAPASEPVTLAEVRAMLRIPSTVTSHDTAIEGLYIPAARAACEQYMNRRIISQKWEISLDSQPSVIELPGGTVSEVDSVTTYDDDGSTTTTESATTTYHTKTGEQAMVWLRNGATWTTTTRAYDVMRIIYTVGWADADAVPDTIRLAVMAAAVHFYDNPGATGADDLPAIVKAALQPWRIYKV